MSSNLLLVSVGAVPELLRDRFGRRQPIFGGICPLDGKTNKLFGARHCVHVRDPGRCPRWLAAGLLGAPPALARRPRPRQTTRGRRRAQFSAATVASRPLARPTRVEDSHFLPSARSAQQLSAAALPKHQWAATVGTLVVALARRGGIAGESALFAHFSDPAASQSCDTLAL